MTTAATAAATAADCYYRTSECVGPIYTTRGWDSGGQAHGQVGLRPARGAPRRRPHTPPRIQRLAPLRLRGGCGHCCQPGGAWEGSSAVRDRWRGVRRLGPVGWGGYGCEAWGFSRRRPTVAHAVGARAAAARVTDHLLAPALTVRFRACRDEDVSIGCGLASGRHVEGAQSLQPCISRSRQWP